jgi:very-short-patch-repair endonuclease
MHITRILRKESTLWERKLWNVLRNRKIKNAKFRRQFKIGNFVVDFCCLEGKLIVELDGSQHNKPKNKEYDQKRQKYLESLRFKILRFWNNEIDNNLSGVVDRIIENL